MKKKLLLALLVVLMVGILAFSVFACGPKEPTNQPSGGGNNNNTDDGGEDVGVSVDAGPMLNGLIDSVNNTIKVVNTIEDKASVNAELYVDVIVTDEQGNDVAYNVDLKIAGSIDKGTKANNWALISANVLDTVEIGLFAEVTSAGKEYLYLGQNILDEEFTWSKLSQAQDAGLIYDKALTAVFDLVADLEEAKFAADDETFKGADVSDTIDSGLLNKIGIINTIKGLGSTIGGLLFAPIEGVNTIVDDATDLSSANGFAARLNIEELSGVIEGVMPMLGGLLGDVNLADYQGIVDMVVPLLLGGELNLTTLTFTPIEGAIPDIRLLVDINDDKTFGGLHLSYESEKNGIYVGFGLDNISFTNKSSKASSNAPDGVEDAEELAINLGLDIELDAITNGYANLDLNIYPNVSLGWDEDGYVAIDFSDLYAEVVLSYDATDFDEQWNIIKVPTSTVIAQYNADGNEDIIIDLDTVAGRFDTGAGTYKVPVNLSEKFAAFIQSEKDKKAAGNDVVVENAGLVDDIIGIVGDITAEDADIVGVIMDAAGKIGTIIEEVSALAEFIEDGTLDLEGLILDLIADDGLIGESEKAVFGMYTGEGSEQEDVALADIMLPDAVLGNIAALVNAIVYENSGSEATYEEWAAGANLLTVDEIIGLVADFTGATLNAENAYANMEVSASAYWQDGIGASVSAVLGGDDATGEIKLAISANRIANNPEIEAIEYSQYVGSAIVGNEIITVSNDTGVDGGARLLNAVKKIFNSIITDEQFHLDTFEEYWGTVVTDNFFEAGDGSYAFKEDGFGMSFVITAEDAPEGSTVSITNFNNALSVAAMVMDTNYTPARPVPGTPVEIAELYDSAEFTVEGSDGFMFYVLGTEATVVEIGVSVEKPIVIPEPDAEDLVIGDNTTPAFVAGTSLADPGVDTYLYTYTAVEACTLTFTYDDEAVIIGTAEYDAYGNKFVVYSPYEDGEVTLEAGQTIIIGVANVRWDAYTAVTFTVAIA